MRVQIGDIGTGKTKDRRVMAKKNRIATRYDTGEREVIHTRIDVHEKNCDGQCLSPGKHYIGLSMLPMPSIL